MASLLGGGGRREQSAAEKKVIRGVKALFKELIEKEGESFNGARIEAQVEYLSEEIGHSMTNDGISFGLDNKLIPAVLDVLLANGFAVYVKQGRCSSRIFLPDVDVAHFVEKNPEFAASYERVVASGVSQ